MFVREKRIGPYSYLYLVETVRENGTTKQRIIRNLGRTEEVEASGDLDRLARSAAQLSQRSMILSLIEGGYVPKVRCRRIGAPLVFERLWQESGCRTVVEELLAGRRFEFAVERAVFLTVLHRLMVSGSDRACENWRDIFKTTKAILNTRPIYHQTDAAIRGHVFCSFLALVLRKALEDRLTTMRSKPEWGALLMDLDRLQEIETEQEGKSFILRTPVTGDVGRAFSKARV